MIRPATTSDAGRIADIYNQAILDGSFATCDVEPVSVESRASWLVSRSDRHPVFAFEDASGGIRGWSSLGPFSVRPACDHIAEVAVYVAQSSRRQMIGAHLLVHLVKAARDLGFRSLLALILSENRASLRGAEACGFEEIAHFADVARLRGQRRSVVWLQRRLDDPVSDASVGERFARRLARVGGSREERSAGHLRSEAGGR